MEAKPGSWLYHSEVLTDQTPEEVCTSIVREKLLEYLPKEVPYTMTQVSHNGTYCTGNASNSYPTK